MAVPAQCDEVRNNAVDHDDIIIVDCWMRYWSRVTDGRGFLGASGRVL